MRKLFVIGAALLALAACTTSGKPSAIQTSSVPPVSTAISSSAEPTPIATSAASSTPAPPPTPTIGKPFRVSTSSGDVTLTIGTPGPPVTDPDTDGTVYYELGFPVTVTALSGMATVDWTDFALTPTDDDIGNGVTDQIVDAGVDEAAEKATCGSTPILRELAISKGIDTSDGFTVTTTPLTGCITFNYDKAPTGLVFNIGFTSDNPTWPVSLGAPVSAPPTPVSQLVYKITSNAHGLLAVTYFSNDGETQDTDIKGGNWSKTINPDNVDHPIINAQGNGTGTYIACSITLDGAVVSQNRSNGKYSVVDCNPQ